MLQTGQYDFIELVLKQTHYKCFWIALRLENLGYMGYEPGSLTLPNSVHLSEGQKEQSPARMFGISESDVQSSDDGGFLLQTFTPSFPALSYIYPFPFPPKLVNVPCMKLLLIHS